MQTTLHGTKKLITIDTDGPVTIIGEKINPTGQKKMASALLEKNFDYIRELATRQVAYGADILDVNVGVPGLDEESALAEVAQIVSGLVDIPICLDSPNPAALARAIDVIPGKPLINSVSGEEKKLSDILPIVKAREAAVIGLAMDDDGIPATAEGRLKVAEKIIERATRLGIPQEDVIIDPLVLTVGADSKAAELTLATIRLIREQLGVNINLGASNVSFGLPERLTVNQAFLALSIGAGASCVISDPMKLANIVRASDLLLGRDEYAIRYIRYFRSLPKDPPPS
jgi:5-methyltetrahydrofolate--homocysteine methyltransferase